LGFGVEGEKTQWQDEFAKAFDNFTLPPQDEAARRTKPARSLAGHGSNDGIGAGDFIYDRRRLLKERRDDGTASSRRPARFSFGKGLNFPHPRT
jgi:hypothetical protein